MGFLDQKIGIFGGVPIRRNQKCFSKWEVFLVPHKVRKCEFHHILVCTGSCVFVYYMGGRNSLGFHAGTPGEAIILV